MTRRSDDPMAAISSDSLLKLILFALLGSLFPLLTHAAQDPAKALQTEFEAAKTSLSAGDLASAENHYVGAIALGLRQLAQLSLSLGQTEQAASYLDSAQRLKPGDVEAQLDAAGAWFRKGEVGR